jgi:glycine betaine/proline transport system substrate-binding protein
MRRPFAIMPLVVGLVLVAGCGGQPARESGETTIVVAELDWQGARAVGHVLAEIMEERLGLEVELVAVTSGESPLDRMAEGDGSLDVYPDLWMPDQSEAWQAYIEAGSAESILVNESPYTGTEGIYVPGFVQDEHGIRHVDDLVSPGAAALFDNDGDGKGEYWPGPPDWNSTRIQLVKAQSYGYAQHFEALPLTDDEFTTQLKADYELGKAALFYYWTPAWIHAAFDLRRLEEPPFDGYATVGNKDDPLYNPDGCWKMIQPDEDEAWLTKSRIRCASPDAKVYVAYSGTLRERAPAAARFLRRVALSPEMVNGWNLLLVEYDLDPAEMAKEWIARNREIVDGWLAENSTD